MRFGKQHRDALESELHDHLEREAEDNIERGMSAPQARAEARRKFGSAAMIAEDVRAVWVPVWLDQLGQDVRSAWRLLARHRWFATMAVLSMALGIAGSAVILAVLDGVVFHPLAIPSAERVVGVGATFPRLSEGESFVEVLSTAEYLDLADARSIGRFAVFDLGNRNISGGDRPERVFTGLAVTDPFAPFAMAPALGRGFVADELQSGGPPAAILSHRIWRTRFAADPAIVGKPIRVNGRSTPVVGVMPPELLILGVDLWIPWGADPAASPRTARQFTLIGRLAEGATLEAANAELSTLTSRVERDHQAEFPEYAGWKLRALPWAETLTLESRGAGRLLLVAVAALLLIACANVSNLLVAHATSRRDELAVRMATGATPLRLARQLLTESLVLAGLGAAAGLLMASPAVSAMMRLIPPQLNTIGLSASLNGRVLVWSVALTVGCAVLATLSPLASVVWPASHRALTVSTRGATSGALALRVRRGLAATEIALAVVLLCGAVLLTRSMLNVSDVDTGVDTDRLLTMRLTLPQEKYRGDAVPSFFQQLVDRVEELPGVASVALASQFPPQSMLTTQFRAADVVAAGQGLPTAAMTVVNYSLFSALGIPVVRGRSFATTDTGGSPAVIMVNETFTARYLPGVNPIGQRLIVGPANRPGRTAEIVGVVRDTRNRGVRTATVPELFVPLPQIPNYNQLFLMVRSERDPATLVPELRAAIAAIDPDQPVYMVQTMNDAFADAEFRQRASWMVLMMFAAVGLVLGALGIYSVISYGASTRAREFAVRLSLGAGRPAIGALVFNEALHTIVIGVGIGVVATIWATQSLRGMLVGVAPGDPLTLVFVAASATVVGLTACAPAIWRATTTEPAIVLKA